MAQESKIDSMNLFDMLNVPPIDVKKVVGGKTCRTFASIANVLHK